MRTSFGLALLTLIVLCVAGGQSSDAVRYRASRPLNFGGKYGDFCYCNPIPWDLSESGDIAGLTQVHDYGDCSLIHEADIGETIFWDVYGYAAATNDLGEFAGQVRGWPYTRSRAYFRTAAGQTVIGHSMPDMEVFPAAMNDSSLIVGSMGEANVYRAFRWNPLTDEIAYLGDIPGGNDSASPADINAQGKIVGSSQTGRGGAPNSPEAFVWTESAGMQRMPDLEDGYATRAVAINDRGQILGWSRNDDAEAAEPFVWDPDHGYVVFGPSVSDFTYVVVSDLNIHGQVVGYGYMSDFQYRAFIWEPTNGLRFLDELVDPCHSSPPLIVQAGAINDRGVIAAHCDCIPYWWGTVMLLTPYLLGDLDENRQVDIFDLVNLLRGFGRADGATFTDGDMDCDGDVDAQDLSILLAAFGQSLP